MPFDGSTLAAATAGSFVGNVFSDTFTLSGTDVDIIALNLSVGLAYTFDIDNGTAGDLYLRVFDQLGNEVRANDDGFRADDDVVFANSPWFQFLPALAGTYFVAVSPYYLTDYDPVTTANRNAPANPISSTNGTLTVSAASNDLFPSNTTITSITPEDSADETDSFREEDGRVRVQYRGAVDSAGDIDIARIDTVKGDVFVLDVNGVEGNGTVLRVFNSAGTQLLFNDDSGTGLDPEGVLAAPFAQSLFVGLSGEGNDIYDPLEGTDTVAGTIGEYEVIIHKNPTQIGSGVANSFVGNSNANYIVALSGNDTAFGNDGNDTLAGGDDQDSLNGGRGQDYLYGEHGNDTLLGDVGNDVLAGGLGDDSLDGGQGLDLIDGGDGNDILRGGLGASSDTLNGGAGNDSLKGQGGGDRVVGDEGDDTVLGDEGNDTVLGGSGNDTVQGGDQNDVVDGGDNDDLVQGGQGDDLVVGGTGIDSVEGNAGNDRLLGGDGNDSLRGAAGTDNFVFLSTAVAAGIDVVEDMLPGTDRIDLSQIFLGTGSVVNAGNLSQFVQTTTSGTADSFLRVDADGFTGGSNFVTIAQVIGLDAAALFDANNFLL